MSAERTMVSPKAIIAIVISAAVLIMFGAMIFGQLSSAVNSMPFMDPTDPAYDEQAESVVKSVQSNAWIGFSLLAIIVLIIVAYSVIAIF